MKAIQLFDQSYNNTKCHLPFIALVVFRMFSLFSTGGGCARSDIFRQNCPATKMKAIQLFEGLLQKHTLPSESTIAWKLNKCNAQI